MADFGRQETITLEAAADLRLNQYLAVRVSAANKCNVASDGALSTVVGILQNKPNTGQFADVAYFGKSKAIAGGTVTAGQQLTYNGSGRVITVVSGNQCVGMALESGADTNTISVLLKQPHLWSGAP